MAESRNMKKTYMIEFDFVNGKAMRIKMLTGYRYEVEQWLDDNEIFDGKIYEMQEVKR